MLFRTLEEANQKQNTGVLTALKRRWNGLSPLRSGAGTHKPHVNKHEARGHMQRRRAARQSPARRKPPTRVKVGHVDTGTAVRKATVRLLQHTTCGANGSSPLNATCSLRHETRDSQLFRSTATDLHILVTLIQRLEKYKLTFSPDNI